MHSDEEFKSARPDSTTVRSFLSDISRLFSDKPFKPHRFFSGGHAQTLAAYAWPRRYRFNSREVCDERRLFEIEPQVQVLAHCRWQQDRTQQPTILIWHGMEGSTESVYMLSVAEKSFHAGFNVIRVNYRNCGGTEDLSPTLYHGGMSNDLRIVLAELIAKDRLSRICIVGFSLGGNLVLKLLGEYGEGAPEELIAACVVSPSVDLGLSTDLILAGKNWLYQKNFMHSLKQRIRRKHQLFPDLYDITRLSQIRTIKDFDEEFTSRSSGFQNADDYYYQSSSIRVVDKIRVPTLVIHARDDPFIPFTPLSDQVFLGNDYILVIGTDHGGHVAFISKKHSSEDRFWAENRAVEFCLLAASSLRP